MKRKYCVLSGIKSQLLKDLLNEIIRENSDFAVIQAEAPGDGGAKLDPAVTDDQVGLVLCEFDSDVIPEPCQALFKRNRNTVVAGLINDCRQLAIFADDSGLELLKSVLRNETKYPGETS